MQFPHNDGLVITLRILDTDIKRVFVDQGSVANIINIRVIEEMKLTNKIIHKSIMLTGFNNSTERTLGEIILPVVAGGVELQTVLSIMSSAMAYNMIVGRPWIQAMKAKGVPRVEHFEPESEGKKDKQIYQILQQTESSINDAERETIQDTLTEGQSTAIVEDLDPMSFDDASPKKRTFIGCKLHQPGKYISVLRDNINIFAFCHADMTGIAPKVATHTLHIDPYHRPVKQPRRRFPDDRSKFIEEEVQRLLDAGSIRPVDHTEWMLNVVVVPKKNGKLRMCVDFTDLNKACLKDPFPLPHIDQMIDATAGHELLSFLDAYSGYNQIKMNLADQTKTTFITLTRLHCSNVMPFGLKKAGATYQRLVTTMFKDQLGKTMEVYIDNMVVKSERAEDHLIHLKEAFAILRQFYMKLNPKKCAFGVSSGNFLGFMVSKRGIEINPDQIKVTENILDDLNSKKEVQSLSGQVAALSRFISRSSERCHKLFTVLKKHQYFEWTPECKQALQELKRYLSSPPLLSKPNPEEKLFLYFAVSEVSINAVLVREEEGKQSPIYYVSKILLDAEARYPHLEKLVVALIHAARKLRHYFQSHPIVVVPTFPLRSILHRSELSGRLAKWAIELSEFDITYQPRNAIKSQILADFVGDFSSKLTLEVEKETTATSGSFFGIWTLYTDGESNESGLRLGLVLKVPSGEIVCQTIKCPKITNNEAENKYEVVVVGLKLALEYGVESIKVHCDSELVVNQELEQVPRESNAEADGLAKLASAANLAEPGSRSMIHLLHPIGCEIEAESTNKTILKVLKRRIGKAKRNWPDVLPKVLWSYRVTHKTSTGETPFLLVYGVEALVPIEVMESNIRYVHPIDTENMEAMKDGLNLLKEHREFALIKLMAQKQQVERYYNNKTKLRQIKLGDLVMRMLIPATKIPNEGKVGANWEGPYRVIADAGKGTFQLETLDRKNVSNNYNISNLKLFHS
ncbi:uncharacterized protein LOC132620012 [Lycium barbarum]|uniref:uncharacterized protein LOC132620012 n=1 Tax=Lycium barbarum TaxID=112863 RepID=UPI00293EE48A|nr:uncharacterized protein LOC132620012 [Lycium barbarum]